MRLIHRSQEEIRIILIISSVNEKKLEERMKYGKEKGGSYVGYP